jgi:hypothetical protein
LAIHFIDCGQIAAGRGDAVFLGKAEPDWH